MRTLTSTKRQLLHIKSELACLRSCALLLIRASTNAGACTRARAHTHTHTTNLHWDISTATTIYAWRKRKINKIKWFLLFLCIISNICTLARADNKWSYIYYIDAKFSLFILYYINIVRFCSFAFVCLCLVLFVFFLCCERAKMCVCVAFIINVKWKWI